jgi:hypothetical protein
MKTSWHLIEGKKAAQMKLILTLPASAKDYAHINIENNSKNLRCDKSWLMYVRYVLSYMEHPVN